jgi:hypothetical protein
MHGHLAKNAKHSNAIKTGANSNADPVGIKNKKLLIADFAFNYYGDVVSNIKIAKTQQNPTDRQISLNLRWLR